MNYGPKVFTLSMDHYQEKFKQSIKGNVLVCIDAANLERSVKTMWVNPKDIPDEFKRYQSGELCYRVDYQKVKDFFQSNGLLNQVRMYTADFGTLSHRNFLAFLHKRLHFKLITKTFRSTNSSNNRLLSSMASKLRIKKSFRQNRI